MALKNSLHRKNHKERAQLVGRKRLGLLEKHKDYVLRAKDYHSKQDRIKRLRQKAAERNKDEFYFAMKNAKTKRGLHVASRGNEALPTDMVKVLKSQDANYIRTVRNAGRKKISALREQLTSLANLVSLGQPEESGIVEDDIVGGLEDNEVEALRQAGVLPPATTERKRSKRQPGSSHVIFVENDEEASSYQPPASVRTSSYPAPPPRPAVDLGWIVPETSKKEKGKARERNQIEDNTEMQRTMIREDSTKHRTLLFQELAARLKRDTSLRYAERELEMQKLLMGKGANKKIHGPEKLQHEDKARDEDEADFLASKRRRKSRSDGGLDEAVVYKPRVYKWRQERKS